MSYTALYRKFRPSEFKDVKGQGHIVATLKNQIKADRNRKDHHSQDICKSGQLRKPGGRQPLWGMCILPGCRSGQFHECH